ncbi:molybdenum ABC transporter ATP-binding protein [Hyphomicrobium methylovorum]|uniref:molybdenum ABC transporter ATP-binding protein n=1 Tax=Hyphomicrobium methylovorum TaxID=84 RepID=UPI0015E731EE|nr:molybdenum ABC transporter ATP-binding protein [Hyphomicrobium methylovorum]MBA2125494.1 molybdenum ABC transporter ATP-binding protein [Hyphomicrobium methylovorum]
MTAPFPALAPILSVDAHLSRGAFKLAAAFDAGPGITALFGPSGSGKSTLLNVIAGVLRPERGHVVLNGETLTDTQKRIFLPPHKRRIGFVFQDAQLFPHLTVEQNMKFGRWFRRASQSIASFDVVADTLGILPLLKRRPATLSGGERQRVALARALLSSPQLLLMDEPLAGLDDKLRQEIMTLIEHIRDEFRVPIVYVTHTRDEVRRLASRVVKVEQGEVESSGSVPEILGA